MIADPCAVHADPRMRALGELAVIVTRAPWALARAHHDAWLAAGLTEDDLLHAIMLSSYFGHLNRIADAVAVPLDYVVQLPVPVADPRVPALDPAPHPVTGRPAIDPARRPATVAAIAGWRTYVFERDAPLSRRQRTVLARWVSRFLGDGGISSPDDLTANPIDTELRALAEVVTLAPWQITNATFQPLRDHGFDDAALFDACAVASSAGTFSRITVALAAMSRDRA